MRGAGQRHGGNTETMELARADAILPAGTRAGVRAKRVAGTRKQVRARPRMGTRRRARAT